MFASDSESYFVVDMVFFLSMLIWDVLPLLINFHLHHKSFKLSPLAPEEVSEFEYVKTEYSQSQVGQDEVKSNLSGQFLPRDIEYLQRSHSLENVGESPFALKD